MLHRSTNYHQEMPQHRHQVSFKGVGTKSQSSKVLCFRCYLVIAAIILIALHLHLISIMDHELQGRHKLQIFDVNQNFVDLNQSMNEPKQYPQNDFTQATVIKYTAKFNNIPVQRIDGPPKVTTSKCVSPTPQFDNAGKDDKFGWMYRTCEYKNLCFDTALRQYVAVSNGGDDDDVHSEFRSVSIGGINPRWMNTAKNETTTLIDLYNSDIRKVQWKPKIKPKYDASSTSYYRMDDEYIFIPFHSMAGHNVGHLIWDDLYAIYTALRLRSYITTDPNEMNSTTILSHELKFLFLRHVLEESTEKQQQQQQLYANCDVRRNKRIQCKNNFERFLPLFGNVDVRTFFTSKTTQLNAITTEVNDNVKAVINQSSSSLSSSLVCFDKTIAGIGLLTDHGWNDHGWETPSSQRPPHNLGRGRLFYDFTQYLVKSHHRQLHLASTTISSVPKTAFSTTTIDEQWIPQITFSIESSRDWSRRLNFTNQINALKAISDDRSGLIHRDFVVQSYRMYELSLSQQIDVAMKTNIFVSVCGGGSMTTTFLPRNTVVILFYDPQGGHDFYDSNVHPNALPARLDWDLLNNAAHLRVHWLPISSMNTPDHTELFIRLVRHELTMIHNMRTTL